METSVNTLNNTNYKATTSKALGIISTALLVLTVCALFITTGTINSLELFVAIPLIICIGLLAISDIAYNWTDSKILAIAGLIGSLIMMIAYVVIFPITTTSALSFAFYLWAVAIVARIVSICLDGRKLED